ncbi:MAG: aldo/keto reductase [Microthrixaceae bacterium]
MVDPSRPDRLSPGLLSIGTAPLGGLYSAVDEADALATLAAAAESGVTHFDTAPHYGRGLAEERLGKFLAQAERPDRFTVSTKVGRRIHRTGTREPDDIFHGAPPGGSKFDFAPDAIREELGESRTRLGREFVDVVLLHDPDDHLDEAVVAAGELQRQRDAGFIGAIGVGTNSAEVAHYLLDRVPLDVVLLAGRITLLETSGESVADRCAREGVVLLAAGAFQSGILAGGTDTYFDYQPAPERVLRRVEDLRSVCNDFGVSLQQVAINHPRRFNGVASTLVGVRSTAEVTAAVGAISVDLPEDLWSAIDGVRACHGGIKTRRET